MRKFLWGSLWVITTLVPTFSILNQYFKRWNNWWVNFARLHKEHFINRPDKFLKCQRKIFYSELLLAFFMIAFIRPSGMPGIVHNLSQESDQVLTTTSKEKNHSKCNLLSFICTEKSLPCFRELFTAKISNLEIMFDFVTHGQYINHNIFHCCKLQASDILNFDWEASFTVVNITLGTYWVLIGEHLSLL